MTRVLHDLAGAGDERFSPYCWRAKMALLHKGLTFEARPTEFTRIAQIADGAQKTVPVFEDDGRIVSDSFVIALDLDERYPDRPGLFGGQGGVSAARFVEAWAATALHPVILGLVVSDIHNRLTMDDQRYFRQSREARFGKSLEDIQHGRDQRVGLFHAALEPLRRVLGMHPFLGGTSPLFVDYIVFGTLQWPHRVSSADLLPPQGDPVRDWFSRCAGLYPEI